MRKLLLALLAFGCVLRGPSFAAETRADPIHGLVELSQRTRVKPFHLLTNVAGEFPSERVIFKDTQTGATIWKMSRNPGLSRHDYRDQRSRLHSARHHQFPRAQISEIKMMLSIRRSLLLALALAAFTADEARAEPIDRRALVARHDVVLLSANPQEALQVGNGRFAFGVDVTGLQSFYGLTMSDWGWHSAPLPAGLKVEDPLPDV